MTQAAPAGKAERDLPGSLAQYSPEDGCFDECVTAETEPRGHYSRLIHELDRLGSEELHRREETARRIIHEQGITYNVYGDPKGMERPWRLDPIPLLIGSEEWRGIEGALRQRATLINAILADCYGSQDLIRSGWLPPALGVIVRVQPEPVATRPLALSVTPDGSVSAAGVVLVIAVIVAGQVFEFEL